MHTRILNFWTLEVGQRSVINQYVVLDCRRYRISIGNDVDIGPYTRLWTLGHDPDAPDHAVTGGEVLIGDHVWVASGVTILPGVALGRGCVVAASSVVTKSIPPVEVWGGVPAKFLRPRKNRLEYSLNYTPYFE